MTKPKRKMTAHEVAAAAGTGYQNVIRLANAGALTGGEKVGRNWIFTRPVRIIPGKRGRKSEFKEVK